MLSFKKPKYAYTMALASFFASSLALSQGATNQEWGELSKYLADVADAPVSAASIIGINVSGISNVQTSHDIAILLGALTSRDSKDGFGFSLTPGRTKLSPISGRDYKDHIHKQLLANFTVSYAENASTISGASYRKKAISADIYFYTDEDDDPILINYRKFTGCSERRELETDIDDLRKNQFENKTEALQTSIDAIAEKDKKLLRVISACKIKLVPEWNASRISVSYGVGRIEKDSGGNAESLGHFLTISGVYKVSNSLGLFGTYRHTRNAVDPTTMATKPTFSNSNLVAVRLASEPESDKTWRFLAEVSNAGSSSASKASATYMHAIGIDKKLASGIWLQFRYGKSTTLDGNGSERKSMINFAVAPSLLAK